IDLDYVIAPRKLPDEIEWLVKPMHALNAVRRARYNEQQARAANEATFAGAMAMARVNEELSARSELEVLFRPGMAMREVFELHYRARAARRAAAVMLAMRLYQLEHEGRLPRRLEELTPR